MNLKGNNEGGETARRQCLFIASFAFKFPTLSRDATQTRRWLLFFTTNPPSRKRYGGQTTRAIWMFQIKTAYTAFHRNAVIIPKRPSLRQGRIFELQECDKAGQTCFIKPRGQSGCLTLLRAIRKHYTPSQTRKQAVFNADKAGQTCFITIA